MSCPKWQMPHLGLKGEMGIFLAKREGGRKYTLQKIIRKRKEAQGDALQRLGALSVHLEVSQVCVAQGWGQRHHGEPSHSVAAEKALEGGPRATATSTNSWCDPSETHSGSASCLLEVWILEPHPRST